MKKNIEWISFIDVQYILSHSIVRILNINKNLQNPKDEMPVKMNFHLKHNPLKFNVSMTMVTLLLLSLARTGIFTSVVSYNFSYRVHNTCIAQHKLLLFTAVLLCYLVTWSSLLGWLWF